MLRPPRQARHSLRRSLRSPSPLLSVPPKKFDFMQQVRFGNVLPDRYIEARTCYGPVIRMSFRCHRRGTCPTGGSGSLRLDPATIWNDPGSRNWGGTHGVDGISAKFLWAESLVAVAAVENNVSCGEGDGQISVA